MINTLNIKQAQLKDGFYKVGSGPEKVFIMGSCRVTPYVNYFNEWNQKNGNRFTIFTLDPFNWHWDLKDNRVDYDYAIKAMEYHSGLLGMLGSVNTFIHEYYQNAGMFNCEKSGKNIYQFGLTACTDICIPNFNDLFILYSDIVAFDLEVRKKAVQDYAVIGKLSEKTDLQIFDIALNNILKFYGVCDKSDFPEMGQYFKDNFLNKRLFWNSNHVSKHFTLAVFKFMNDKFMHLELTDSFLKSIQQDMFANNYTYLTSYDVQRFGYEWGEGLKPLL